MCCHVRSSCCQRGYERAAIIVVQRKDEADVLRRSGNKAGTMMRSKCVLISRQTMGLYEVVGGPLRLW